MNILSGAQVFISLGALLFLYSVGLAVYRLYFHPLAKFPGPKLAALTLWYEAYYDLWKRGNYTFKIAELHKEYGKIDHFFQAAPERLLIITLFFTARPHYSHQSI